MTISENPIDQSPDNGQSVLTSKVMELQKHIFDLSLDVRAKPYGAKGDGVTDDRPAIQAAIDACSAAGGGYVYLPAGNYLLGSGGLIMCDHVNLVGAGMYNATLHLGDQVNKPVISDESAGKIGAYAFGRIHLANFGIDGNRANNPNGLEGIFTTAYYSIFENLYIYDCQTHGIRMGFSMIGNTASQNRVSGCRISDCSGAGIYLDNKAVDHTITENYIHDCDAGIYITNGGVRVFNNDIYNHTTAGIVVNQTVYDLIILGNDLNGNRRAGISIQRTSVQNARSWGQILVSNNSIFGNDLEADNLYDGILVRSPVINGIDNITLTGNKIFSLGSHNRFRYGINLAENISGALCAQNHIDNPGLGRYNVGPGCSGIKIDSLGDGAVEAPLLPSSGIPLLNPYHAPMTVYIVGGEVEEIAIGGTSTGQVAGNFYLSAGQTILVTYRTAPGWSWIAN